MLLKKNVVMKEVTQRQENLQTIICLLESQARFREKDALKAIEKTQHDLCMSLIHQKLIRMKM